MRTHVAIQIRLEFGGKETLHSTLRRFASETPGWKFPPKESEDYQEHHDGSAGFVVSQTITGLERAAVAIAQRTKGRANSFCVPNIVPGDKSSLTLNQYNAIGGRFAGDFRRFIQKKKIGSLKIIGPEIGLPQIISARKCRKFFDAWLRSPAPTSHPSDIWVLDQFTCATFRYRASVNLYDLETHLVRDRGWDDKSAAWAVRRIQTGLDILQVNRRF